MRETKFIDKLLQGLSLGIVVALIPSALLGELMKALSNYTLAQNILIMSNIAATLLPAVVALCIGMSFKLDGIEIGSLVIATVIGSGVVKISESGFMLKGTGDVINTAITAAIAVLIITLLAKLNVKAYKILLTPVVVVVFAGLIGRFTLPYVSAFTLKIGEIIQNVTGLQPYIMGVLIAIIFGLLIVSPFSTVGIAVAIKISGVASGAANLGIVAVGLGLAVSGFRVNTLGTSLAHFLGSPKMQMANFVKKPIMIIPMICNAAVLGLLAAIFNIQGTTFSAGFGLSGLIGPINAYNTGSSIYVILFIFILIPILNSFIFDYIFKKVFPVVTNEDYKLNF